MPLNPGKILDLLPIKPPSAKRFIYIPPKQMALNIILLKSSFPKGTELHQFNAKFASKLRYFNNMPI